ncbi:hypothetical protein GJ496_003617 [Pomphorhynchus laevis]|nr:hypothetical protein GJ496_005071 [Pomphorhynchus laevis]KAI0987817.1 hypothetical protein GJ496_003617 [Pomphorhynchus laevis]
MTFWDKIKVVINKREWIKTADASTGMFQGFTGTMDTLLHLHVAYFCIREGKASKIIEQDEFVIAMTLIDDGVICLPFGAG